MSSLDDLYPQSEYDRLKTLQSNLHYFIKKVFSTDDGKRLIDELKTNYLMQNVAPLGYDQHYPYYREGQNDLIRMFIMIVEADK